MAVDEAPEPATEYVAWAQNRLQPSGEFRGSAPVVHQPQLVKIHAVALDEGEAAQLSVCGRHSARELDSEDAKPFDQIPLQIR